MTEYKITQENNNGAVRTEYRGMNLEPRLSNNVYNTSSVKNKAHWPRMKLYAIAMCLFFYSAGINTALLVDRVSNGRGSYLIPLLIVCVNIFASMIYYHLLFQGFNK